MRNHSSLGERAIDAGDAVQPHVMQDFFALKFKAIWAFFKKEHPAFWAICGYLFIEYVRPQTIVDALDILPWGKLFIALSVIGWFMDRSTRWVKAPTNKWMLLFLLVIIAASFNAYWPEVSWFHFMDFFGWFLAYFLIINIVNSEKRLFIFLFIFLLASFKLSQHGARTWTLRGFGFTNWGLMGPRGYFQNSGELSVQMLMFAPIAYRLAVVMRPWLSKMKYWFLMAFPLTAMMTVMGASSRGAQLGLVFQIYHTFLKGKRTFKALLVAGIVGALVYNLLPEEQLERFRSAGDDRTSQQRLLYWQNGLEMIENHPWLGVGYFNFAPYFSRYYPEDMLYESAQLPHNIFVQIGTDAGFLGLGVYGMLIFSCFNATRLIRKQLAHDKGNWLYQLSLGYDAAFVGFLIAGQFVTIGYYPFMWIHLAFVVATRNIVKKTYGGGGLEPSR